MGKHDAAIRIIEREIRRLNVARRYATSSPAMTDYERQRLAHRCAALFDIVNHLRRDQED